MKKLIIFTLIIFVLTTAVVFATETIKTEYGDIPYYYSYKDRDKRIQRDVYTFDIITSKPELKVLPFSDRPVYTIDASFYGADYYNVPTEVLKYTDPWDHGPLNNPALFNHVWRVPRNSAYNFYRHEAWLDSGYKFPFKYPKNAELDGTYFSDVKSLIPNDLKGNQTYQIKINTQDRYTKMLEFPVQEEKLFLTHTSGAKVVVREHIPPANLIHGTVNFAVAPYFPQDFINKVPFVPYTTRFIYMQDLKNYSGGADAPTELNNEYYKNYATMTAEQKSVYTKTAEMYFSYYPVVMQNCKEYAKNKGWDKNNIEHLTRAFVEIYKINSLFGINSGGGIQAFHKRDPNSYTYYGLALPRELKTKNLRVASTDYPIGEAYKGIKIFNESGIELDPETYKPVSGDKITFKWYVGLDSNVKDIETVNEPILSNIYFAFNADDDISEAKVTQLDILGNIETKLTSYNNGLYNYSGKGIPISTGNENRISEYSYEYTIPEYIDGQKVEKLTIWATLPYQYNKYHQEPVEMSNEASLVDDNADMRDDHAKLVIGVENSDRDLKISSFKIFDIDNNVVSELKRGETYNVEIEILNKSETLKSLEYIKAGFSDHFTHTFNSLRDSTAGQFLDSVEGNNPIEAQKTAKYKANFTVPKGYIHNNITLTAFIPKTHDGKDNRFIEEEDIVKLNFNITEDKKSLNNLAITGLDLIDSADGKVYSDKNDSGFYDFKINRRYNIRVKAKYTGETLPINNPEVNLRVTNGDGSFSDYVLRADNYKSFTKNGEELTFTMNGFPYNDTRLTLTASVPEKYTPTYNNNFSDDEMTKTWINSINFQATNFRINPSKVNFKQNDNKTMNLSFSVDLNIQNFSGDSIEEVQFIIKDVRTGSIVFRDNKLVFTKTQQQIRYQGVIENFNLREGNNPFEAVINYDKRYKEENGTLDPYKDNVANANVNVNIINNSNNQILDCNLKNTTANWTQTFYLTKKTGSLESKEVTRTRCSGSGESISCESYEVTVYYCDNVDYYSWDEPRSYTETFKITAVMFKSQSTVEQYGDTFINILGNNKGVVRAGQWYEFYIVTNYKTNRTDMPATSYSNMCNYVTRTPGVSSVNPLMTPQYIDMRIYGYGPEELYKYVTPFKTTGSWSNSTKQFRYPDKLDIFGDTYTRRYIPTTGRDGTINIYVVTYPFDGYYFDELHPDRQFQDCGVLAKIYIKDQLPIQTQIVDEN